MRYVRGRWTLERSRTYYSYDSYPFRYSYYSYPYWRHAGHFVYDNHDNNVHLRKKTVGYAMAGGETKSERRHFHHTARAEEITHRGAPPITSIKQTPDDKAGTLSPGTPLLGLDPRRPSTWELYSQMLPPIFSEAPAQTSNKTNAPRWRNEEPGM
jgi:hypothetical protein